VAPLGLKERILDLIGRETGFGERGRIIAKMNSLVDPEVISALYRASAAGVRIDLLVRGICCLQPGVAGQSENIRVVSVVDRFLEHARIFFFEAGGRQEVYLSSADWMPRNFVRRVEVMFPIDDEAIRDRLLGEILVTQLADNVKARVLLADGSHARLTADNGAAPMRSQEAFIAVARKRAQAVATPRTQSDTPPQGTLIAVAVSKPVEAQAKGSVAPKVPTVLVS
jgi:polyphosphate kinase